MWRLRFAAFASVLAGARGACRYEASAAPLLSWLRSPCEELASPVVESPLAGQVVVNLGPAVRGEADHEGMDSLLLQELQGGPLFLTEELDDFHQDMQGLIDALGMHFADAVRGGAFSIDKELGHLRLRGKLPGYVLSNQDSDGELTTQPPLSVRIVGSSLVVSGHKSAGPLTSSFQRSFALPELADADRITVRYSVRDGTLEVDVPSKEPAAGLSEQAWHLSWEDSGSHTSIVVSSGGAAISAPKPSLRGAKATTTQALFQRLHEMLNLPEEQDQQAVASQVLNLPVQATTAVQVLAQRPSSPEPPALVVQRKDARPFWRLKADGQAEPTLEVVEPDGVTLGRPRGQEWPFFDSHSDLSEGSAPQPIGKVDLPVVVDPKLCRWSLNPPPQERVMECLLDGAAVRALQIHFSEEL